MSRRNNDDFSKVKNLTVAMILSIMAIIGVILLVVYDNRRGFAGKKTSVSSSPEQMHFQPGEISSISESSGVHYTVSDLDFYDLYKESAEDTETSSDTSASTETSTSQPVNEPMIDEATDGKHTLVVYDDGTEEWVAINPNLQKNSYDLTNLVSQSGKMKYFEDSKCVSTFGVDISKDQDYIDFVKLKKAGCNFVMIRVGARGYSTGQLSVDDYFFDNIKRASDAGIDVGVYFLSQAITEDEAKEEAQLVLDSVKGYKIKYPIAYVMQYASGDKARVEALSKKDKTVVAKAFLDAVKAGGYNPMIYGTKAWLIKNLDLTQLNSDYDTWLSQPGDIPDYPYRYAMWKYSETGSIDGISGHVGFNVCLVDYSLK